MIDRGSRDAGFEVVYTGLHQEPEQIAEMVIQDDADAVGLSRLSGVCMTLMPGVFDLLRGRDADEVLVGGGNHPRCRDPVMRALGVGEMFIPGAWLAGIIRGLEATLDELASHAEADPLPTV